MMAKLILKYTILGGFLLWAVVQYVLAMRQFRANTEKIRAADLESVCQRLVHSAAVSTIALIVYAAIVL